jgi:hypothetical protein
MPLHNKTLLRNKVGRAALLRPLHNKMLFRNKMWFSRIRLAAPLRPLPPARERPATHGPSPAAVLRNQAFANLASARDPSVRILAHSTFQGRFFNPNGGDISPIRG